MDGEAKKAMLEYWKKYLNPNTEGDYFDPPPAFIKGFEYGMLYKSGTRAPGDYHCPACGKDSYPDYGRCAFCGKSGENKDGQDT